MLSSIHQKRRSLLSPMRAARREPVSEAIALLTTRRYCCSTTRVPLFFFEPVLVNPFAVNMRFVRFGVSRHRQYVLSWIVRTVIGRRLDVELLFWISFCLGIVLVVIDPATVVIIHEAAEPVHVPDTPPLIASDELYRVLAPAPLRLTLACLNVEGRFHTAGVPRLRGPSVRLRPPRSWGY